MSHQGISGCALGAVRSHCRFQGRSAEILGVAHELDGLSCEAQGAEEPCPDSAQVLVFHGAPLSDPFLERRKPPRLDHPQGRALSSPSAHDPWCTVTVAPRHLEKEGLTALCLGPPDSAPPVFPGWLRPPAPHPAWL